MPEEALYEKIKKKKIPQRNISGKANYSITSVKQEIATREYDYSHEATNL